MLDHVLGSSGPDALVGPPCNSLAARRPPSESRRGMIVAWPLGSANRRRWVTERDIDAPGSRSALRDGELVT